MIVCIAEFLSINETQRLLAELQRNDIRVSHIVVNQVRLLPSHTHPQFVLAGSYADPLETQRGPSPDLIAACKGVCLHCGDACIRCTALARRPEARGGFAFAEDKGVDRTHQRAWRHPSQVPERPQGVPRGSSHRITLCHAVPCRAVCEAALHCTMPSLCRTALTVLNRGSCCACSSGVWARWPVKSSIACSYVRESLSSPICCVL